MSLDTATTCLNATRDWEHAVRQVQIGTDRLIELQSQHTPSEFYTSTRDQVSAWERLAAGKAQVLKRAIQKHTTSERARARRVIRKGL